MKLKPAVTRQIGAHRSSSARSSRSSPVNGGQSRSSALRARQSGLTLLEIMVASALLAIIMLGLMAMFGQTQRAYQGSIRQVDVLESARTVLDMMARDLSQVGVATDPQVITLFAQNLPVGTPNRALMPNQSTALQEFFLLSGEFNHWTGIGYLVSSRDIDAGMGTLYRYSTNVPLFQLQFAVDEFTNPAVNLLSDQRFRRVIDGVVHLRIWPYDAEGNLLLERPDGFAFASNSVPAYVELEIALAEPQLVEQIAALPNDTVIKSNYLAQRPHQVHVFRQQIPIRSALSQ